MNFIPSWSVTVLILLLASFVLAWMVGLILADRSTDYPPVEHPRWVCPACKRNDGSLCEDTYFCDIGRGDVR